MKRIAASILFAASLFAQSGVVFNHPTTTIRGVTIGATYCYFYSQLPAPGSVHVGCWLNGVLGPNHVEPVTVTQISSSFTFGVDATGVCPAGVTCGTITWIFSPGVAPNSINYKLTGTLLPDPGNEPSDVGTF